MDKEEIKIAGNGVINEGKYSKITIMGSAKSNGHVVADEIQVMGNANFDGSVEGGHCAIHGNAHITGDVSLIKLVVNGDLYLDGTCDIRELTVNGKATITGNVTSRSVVTRGGLILNNPLKSEQLKVYGVLNSPTDVSAEDITIEGSIQCKGLLSGENITIHSCASSYCKEIGATNLVVEKPVYHLLWLFYNKKNILTCGSIEADNMKLENVESKIARGKNINLVSNCDISTVEYSESFTKGDHVVIQDLTKVD